MKDINSLAKEFVIQGFNFRKSKEALLEGFVDILYRGEDVLIELDAERGYNVEIACDLDPVLIIAKHRVGLEADADSGWLPDYAEKVLTRQINFSKDDGIFKLVMIINYGMDKEEIND